MLLAGDVGGTKTRIGLFEVAPDRPKALAVCEYATLDFDGLASVLDAFVGGQSAGPLRLDAAAFGVAGPAINGRARLTNVPWEIDAHEIGAAFGIPHVRLLNDLEAMAEGVTVLTDAELDVLQAGEPAASGNAALIAAGTGLGEAMLHRVGDRLVPLASEGGHADFAARTDRELQLVAELTGRYGRAQCEQVVSGPGLVNLHRFTHGDRRCPSVPLGVPEAERPALISQAAINASCPLCVGALELFISAYGAETGNLALRATATAGIYVGGGIAPKILTAVRRGGFLTAFRAKAPMDAFMARIPVKVILNPRTGLLGAAVAAARASLHAAPRP